jgi:hypothetical protein
MTDILVEFILPASNGPLVIPKELREPKKIFARPRCYFIFYKKHLSFFKYLAY